MKILIIEDDENLRFQLSKLLESYGYECAFIDDFEDILTQALHSNADLILLDINLPVYDGFYICREIRQQSNIPIIIVTSRESEMDELMSIHLGADDFITKPYHPQILVARITSVLKRYKKQHNTMETYNNITFYSEQGLLSANDKTIELTKNEMKIFSILLRNKGKIVAREDLMDALWQSDTFIDDNTLTVNMNRLRKKIESLGFPEFIMTKRGQGYYI